MARQEHEAEQEFEEQAQGEGDLPEVGDYQEPAEEAAAEYAGEAAPAEELPEAAEAPAEELAEGEYAAEAEAPAEAEVPAEEYPAAEAPAEEVPAEEVPAEEVPAEEVPAEEVAAEVPAEEVPAEEVPAEVPAEEAPAEAAAAEPVAPASAKAPAKAPARGAPPADKRRPRPEIITEAKTAVPAAAKEAAVKVGAKKAEKVIAGIDLGTTYSEIAYLDEHGKATIIPNSDNERITPSVVLFEEFEIIVGRIAKNNAISMPDRVIEFIKREMGDPDWVKVIDGKEYTPEVISAIILKRIVQDAEAQLGKKIEDVVITCPAYFNDPERKATQDAGRIAGLNVLSLLNEPTAAAIAYGIEALGTDQTVMVYDLGGGTFDVTVLRISGQQIEVVATDGERYLGGKDWDDALINYVAEKFVAEHGVDPREDLEALQDLRNRSEDCKITLSKKTSANLLCHCQGKTLRLKVTREEFESLTRPLLEQTETYVQTVMEKAQLQWKDIDRVLLTGGMTRMPAVVEMLKRVTGKEPSAELNPDEAVALGAAYFAAVLVVQGEAHVTDEAAIQKSLETIPEEIIGMLEGTVVQNVNSHSLGIIILKDGQRKNHIMIPQQTPIPVEKSGPFVTAYDNQTSVTIRVVEGESEDPEDCIQIGECVISDLPAGRPKGSIVEVTYRYNADGRIEVHGRDRQSGKEAMVEIVREAGLSQQQVEAERKEVAQVAVA